MGSLVERQKSLNLQRESVWKKISMRLNEPEKLTALLPIQVTYA